MRCSYFPSQLVRDRKPSSPLKHFLKNIQKILTMSYVPHLLHENVTLFLPAKLLFIGKHNDVMPFSSPLQNRQIVGQGE